MKFVHDPMPAGAHRPDIEGLRAVAVLAVLLFHLGLESFGGGFVGVDIFFVISGFLIGGIVVREAGEGAFRFGDYLVRRVRRIVPVMLLVLAAVTLLACFVLMPSELAGYGWSLGFSALFLANAHFWLHRGAYAESEYEVLLHMWTLGVEAQFYILLPLIVLGLMRFGKTALWLGLVVLALASAAASLLYPSASFYMLPARLWEFLLGMMVAITPLPLLDRRWVREGLSLAGIALIAYAAMAFDTETPFPGWRAAIPCLGAAAIIAAGIGGSSIIGRVLTLAPMRFIGKISYSLYLWHWPLIVLFLLGMPAAGLDVQAQIVIAAASFVLSVLSWRYVEEPLRRRTFPKRPLLIASASFAALLTALAILLSISNGWPARFTEREQQIAASMEYPLDDVFRSGECFIHNRAQSFDADACLVSSETKPEILLIGDSHAAHLWPGLSHNFPGSAISQVTASGCRPVLEQPGEAYPHCVAVMETGWAHVAASEPDLVILAGRWEEGDLPALEDTLGELASRGVNVLLIGPAREWAQFVPRLLVKSDDEPLYRDVDRMQLDERGRIAARMSGIALATQTAYFAIGSEQCDALCRYFDAQGLPMIVDHSHFSHEGSRVFTASIDHPMLIRAAD